MIDKIGELEIRITGAVGNIKLSPESYDIKDIQNIIEKIEDFLYPLNKKDRPMITYDIRDGSVKHIFKTGIQAIIAFTALLGQIKAENSIDFLELKTALAIESLQNLSYEKNYNIDLLTSLSKSEKILITPETKYIRSENLWAEAEFYFYGILTNAGGKNKANIHLDTKEFGSLTFDTPKKLLKESKKNVLYKNYGVRASGKQNIETGEIDRQSMRLLELIDYSAIYDDNYLKSLIKKAKNKWKGIDADNWINDLRGGYVV